VYDTFCSKFGLQNYKQYRAILSLLCTKTKLLAVELFTDEYFMNQAFAEAEQALAEDEIPVGAIVVVNNKIIGRGHNLTERLVDVTAHAEMQAITAASAYLGGKYLKDCTMYITLEPCSMCAGALYWSQIGRIVFAAADEKRGFRTQGGKLHPKTRLEEGLMAERSTRMLKAFFTAKR
jgi:tRNA(adenine34) deaminase